MEKDKIEKLVNILKKASEAYYGTSFPIMNDKEFDALVEELRKFDSFHPFLSKIGGKKGSIKLIPPMLSQQKWLTKEIAIKQTAKLGDCVASLKLDGMAGEVVYEYGKLTNSSTRGDGEYGTNILHKVKIIIVNIFKIIS